MKIDNDKLEIVVHVPDKLTVRKQLEYSAAIQQWTSGNDMFVRFWAGAKAIVDSLECEYLQMDVDIDAVYSPRIVEAITWVGMAVFSYTRQLDELDPNSSGG